MKAVTIATLLMAATRTRQKDERDAAALGWTNINGTHNICCCQEVQKDN
jgi:hypothetical protein